METSSDSKALATQVLTKLVEDCEVVARDPEIAAVTRSSLLGYIAGWRKSIASGDLSDKDLYKLIESVCGKVVVGKKQSSRFDARHPEIIRRLSDAQEFVLGAVGKFECPDGKTIIDAGIV
jgi:hypothetical protein